MSTSWLFADTAWLLNGTARMVLIIGLALLLDTLIGDPVFNWHPVRLIGRFAEAMEDYSRRLFGIVVTADAPEGLGSPRSAESLAVPELVPGSPMFQGTKLDPGTVIAGALAWTLTVGTSASLALGASHLAKTIHPVFGLAIDVLIVWASVAPADLANHALRVERALERDQQNQHGQQGTLRQDPVNGRAAVAMIVGRDVSVLDEAGVARACIESVAESSVDGVGSPIFWAALLGPWAALAYRCVNTMDSIFGHKNTRYYSFGLVAARADDIANWPAARLSSILACFAAPLAGGKSRQALSAFFRYRYSHASPNAGHPEAAYAGAFGLRLGGPVRYPEGLVDKPWLNPGGRDACILDIPRAVTLMYAQTVVSAIAFLACRYALVLLMTQLHAGS